jgi:tetratricopeptide (TPR) repeat protein
MAGWKAKLLIVALIIVFSYMLGILFWPYALHDPLRNPVEAYRVMAWFPDTFRQIFEGRVEWSDYMPWYYLPKSMLITIPVVALGGVMIFILFARVAVSAGRRLYLWLLIFSILFPAVFVIIIKSNLYSSWRQFFFIYPGIVIIASVGYSYLFRTASSGLRRAYIAGLFILMSLSPANFIIRNYPYSYLYYNQLAGGVKGAYGDYETDYYYVSQREASEWLISHLKSKGITDTVTVAANFSVDWFFRDYPHIKTVYVRHEERSMMEWDYLIMTNRYISPFQLKNGLWPPDEAIKIIEAGGIPIGAVIERKETISLEGWKSMQQGDYPQAARLFKEAARLNSSDEMIFFNFAAAMVGEGFPEKADSLLKEAVRLNPWFDLAMMYLGNIAASRDKKEEAAGWYRKTIECNRKYLEAYVALSAVLTDDEPEAAREALRESLKINPGYKPALRAMAESYRETRPDIAEKYDRIADSITDKTEKK